MFNENELKNLAGCVDAVVRQGGIPAARALLPLADKIEALLVAESMKANAPAEPPKD